MLKGRFNNQGVKIGRDALFDYLRREFIQIYNDKRSHLSLNYKTSNFIYNKNAMKLTSLHH